MNLENTLMKADKYLQNNQIHKAIPFLLKAVAENPTDVSARSTLADIYTKIGNVAGAIEHYLAVATEYERRGEIGKSIGILRIIHNINHCDFSVCLELARLYLLENNHHQAEHFLRLCAEDFLQKAHAPGQDEEAALKLLGMMQSVTGKSTNSISILRMQSLLCRKLGREGLACDIELRMGLFFYRQGNLDEALRILQPLQLILPTHLELIQTVLDIVLRQEGVDAAVDYLDTCLTSQSINPQILLLKAKLMVRMGKFEQAEDLYHQAFYGDPSNYRDLLDFAYYLVDAGCFEQAVKQVDCLTGELTFLQKMEVITFCRALLYRDPQNIAALLKLAFYYGEMNDVFQLSVIYITLFQAYLQRNDHERAHQIGKLLIAMDYRDDEFLAAYEKNKLLLKSSQDLSEGDGVSASRPDLSPLLRQSKGFSWPRSRLSTQEVERHVLPCSEGDMAALLLDIELLLKYGAKEKARELIQEARERFGDRPVLNEKLRECGLRKSRVQRAARERIGSPRKAKIEVGKCAPPEQRPPKKQEPPVVDRISRTGGTKQGKIRATSEGTAGFSGSLRILALMDIIQLIAGANKAGSLRIVTEEDIGLLLFNSGRLVSAKYRHLVGEPAVYALLHFSDGAFDFIPSPVPFPESISVSTTHLLLEGLRRLDEARRGDGDVEPALRENPAQQRVG